MSERGFNNEPRMPEGGPPIITPPTSATPGLQKRGVMLAVIQSVDNANFPQFATVLINNKIPGEMGYSIPAGIGPFAAGGTANFHYYYNNASGVGGSYCYVDADARLVISFTGNVSTTPPTPFYKALADHLHNGNLDPDSFQNPQPVDLSNGEVSSILPYNNNSTAVQTVVGSDGSLLATTFPGQVKQITSGKYAGFFQLLTQTVRDVNPISTDQTSGQYVSITWQFVTTYSVTGKNYNPTSGPQSGDYYGPAIWDANGQIVTMGISNFENGGALFQATGFSNNDDDPFINNVHTVQMMVSTEKADNEPSWSIFIDGLYATGNVTLQYHSLTNPLQGPFYFGWYTTNPTTYPPSGVYAKLFRAEMSTAHFMMPPPYLNNWDYSPGNGNLGLSRLTNTQSLSGNTMNVTPYITDFTMHYSINSGATLLTYWYDNGSGGDSKMYNTYDGTGATDINIGHTTSGSPSGTFSVSSGQTLYVLAYYNFSTFSVHWTLQTTPFTGSQVRAAYVDGSLACMASLTTNSSAPSGPVNVTPSGGGTRVGNGGRTQN